MRALLCAATLVAAMDWPGALPRVELYSALIVDTAQDEVARTLLLAAFRDDTITPVQWHQLKLDMSRRTKGAGENHVR